MNVWLSSWPARRTVRGTDFPSILVRALSTGENLEKVFSSAKQPEKKIPLTKFLEKNFFSPYKNS